MTLAEFLNARLDEDEAKASAAARESGYFKIEGWAWYDDDFGGYHLWDADDVNRHYPTDPGAVGNPGVWGEEAERMRERARASRCDLPAQALRDVKAKRAIVKLHEALGARRAAFSEHELRTSHTEAGLESYDHVLRHLAAVYSDHPDYREEWRP